MDDLLLVWTQQSILATAPDAQVSKAAQGLARPSKWQNLGRADAVLWGECQGSGQTPYRVALNLNGPAFNCSCPSAKHPCKHSVGLFLIARVAPDALATSAPPEWVTEWLDKRAAAAARKAKAAEKAAAEKAADPATEAKRAAQRERTAAQREERVQQGVEAFSLWLEDLVRQGLNGLAAQPRSFWEGQAARLVDAQAPGLARMVRELAPIPYTGEGWPARLLERLGRVHLLLEAYTRLETLPPHLQAEVRALFGWSQEQTDVLAQDGVRDTWAVVSAREQPEEMLTVRRTWLWGLETRQAALLLDFGAYGRPLPAPLGATLEGAVAYFSGAYPQRALLKDGAHPLPLTALSGYPTLEAAFAAAGEALARNPWLETLLLPLEQALPIPVEDGWAVRDAAGKSMRLQLSPLDGWRLLGISGGYPVTLALEWDRAVLRPLSVWDGAHLTVLKD